MRKITRKLKPHIRFHTSGLIEILSEASKALDLPENSAISFTIDDDGNLFIKKDPAGLRPAARKGKHYRYCSVSVTKAVFNLPDVDRMNRTHIKSLSFRIGLSGEEDGLIPVITRRSLGKD